MLLFILGFICVNSGWGPVIAIWASGRPAWSVCGEDLCLCIAPSENEPDCPLCVSDLLAETSCTSSIETKPEPRPKRVPRNPHEDALTKAGELGSMSVFIAFAFGTPVKVSEWLDVRSTRFVDPDERLALNQPDIPTPPPRS
jgi:hypothetical protein